MGTNFYQVKDCCDKCGRGSEYIHIGKSSAGWPFHVHIIPSQGINSWADWKNLLKKTGDAIEDEYGEKITLEELNRRVLLKRKVKNEPHVIEAYGNSPYGKICKTGDILSEGEFS